MRSLRQPLANNHIDSLPKYGSIRSYPTGSQFACFPHQLLPIIPEGLYLDDVICSNVLHLIMNVLCDILEEGKRDWRETKIGLMCDLESG